MAQTHTGIAPILHLSLLSAAWLTLSACGDPPSPASCTAASECAARAWCRSGQCVADAPPVAVIDPPAAPGSNRPILVRGGGSHDTDPGDAVVAWTWRASAPAGTVGCDPLPGTGSEVDLSVVFPCAGDHEVSLVVRDTLGVESAVRRVVLHVEPTLDPPTIAVGPDVAIDHRCAGEPLACTTWDGATAEVALEASGSGPPGIGFGYRWTVELPAELARQARPRVTFLPSETAAAPRVRIETSGTAIAGAYVFVVAATDSRGMVAVGRQRVEVGNRPPILAGGGPVLLPHGYEASTRRFVATGETPAARWEDPDGDPVSAVGFVATRSNDGGNVFDVQGLGDRARITIVVPYGVPGDARFLIGPGVSRRVELVVADVNGARASAAWEIEVTNRPPRLVAAVPAASVDHLYEAASRRYLARASLSAWVDDDGDPLSLASAGDPACTEVTERLGTAWVTCAAPFTGRPDPGRLVGIHGFALSAADPFAPGPPLDTRLEIRNRPPRIAGPSLSLEAACHWFAGCCSEGLPKGVCQIHDREYLATTTTVPLVVDDDGDPLDLVQDATGGCLTVTPAPRPCDGASCGTVVTTCAGPSACLSWSPQGGLSVSADDGLAAVAASLDVVAACRP